MNRILAVILLVAICVGGFLYYRKYKSDQALTDGSYTCIGCLPPDKAAAYDRYDHGEGPDPEATTRPYTSSAPLNTQANTVPADRFSTDSSQTNLPAGAGNGRSFNGQPSVQTINQPAIGPRTVAPYPSATGYGTDSLPPDPPNGMRFAGSGSYQWYREGNLTWRINTQTGASCIIYATPEEWRKRIVMQHGCGSTT